MKRLLILLTITIFYSCSTQTEESISISKNPNVSVDSPISSDQTNRKFGDVFAVKGKDGDYIAIILMDESSNMMHLLSFAMTNYKNSKLPTLEDIKKESMPGSYFGENVAENFNHISVGYNLSTSSNLFNEKFILVGHLNFTNKHQSGTFTSADMDEFVEVCLDMINPQEEDNYVSESTTVNWQIKDLIETQP